MKTYSKNPGIEGRILILGYGGAGIVRDGIDLDDNFKRSFDLVPYLDTCAGQIDYECLFLKDSADLTADDVSLIGQTIRQYQNEYDGFVIVGGSDTLPYVASAAAFSLRGLNMPVVFIGARQNAKDWDSDFRLNLPNAIKVARMGCKDINDPSVGEVGILFDDTLVRATAAINKGLKLNNPIESSRVPRLADVGWTIKVEPVTKPRRPSQLNYTMNNNSNIGYFDLVSETHLSSFQKMVEDDTIQGIIIGAFGAGNIPSKLVPSIHHAVYERGKVIGVITNCKKGSSDMGLYDCGALAVKAGAVSLGPMVKPAAIEKMRWAINNAKGHDKFKFLKDAARLLVTSIAEEIPENFSRHAVNMIRYNFLTNPNIKLTDYFNKNEAPKYNVEIKKYCRSSSKYKILVISCGGTFYMQPNTSGSLAPVQRKLNELFDKKLIGIGSLVNMDYMELTNMDSTEMEHLARKEIAKAVVGQMNNYDGFVVLHGTDTMSYTASALSYMLIGLKKDVILTGAQKPGFDFSDFDRNFTKSIKAIIARLEQPKNLRVKAGVKIAFGDKLMLGSTVVKEDEHGLNAFAPVAKHPLLGTLSHPIEIMNITKEVKDWPFMFFTNFDTNVSYFECINGINIKQFERCVENPKISAILIGAYDEGNMPSQMKYYIATAVNSYYKPVAVVSNTDNGVAKPKLDGRFGEFVKSGAIALGDMIKESAFQKLQFAVGVANLQKDLHGRQKLEFIRKVMHTNFTGEISNIYGEMADDVYRDIFYEDKSGLTNEKILERILQCCETVKRKEPNPKRESNQKEETGLKKQKK
ncbi:MAG: asparaginase domain-containing protein [Candidatus Gracilibacteria bacterium]|jgi:L-asparaginase